ncbi:MAG: hypothetical protein HOP35_07040 [Nitrospira sp.]|nr:hypothetical protein [Nitrospira sp.]
MLNRVAIDAAVQLIRWASSWGDGFLEERIGPASAACILPLHVPVDRYFASAGAAFHRSTV